MMQILAACGKNCTGEYPYYEAEEVSPYGPLKDEWLNTLGEDDAFKWLEPHKRPLETREREMRLIVMSRQHHQQAKSYQKFMAAVNPGHTKKTLEKYRRLTKKNLKNDEHDMRRYLATHVNGLWVDVEFEKLIREPHEVFETLKKWEILEEKDRDKMANQIISRDHMCYKGFLEKELQ